MQFNSAQNVNNFSYVFQPRRPGRDDPPPGGPLPGGLPGKHASLVKPRILVVDDELVIADTIAEILNDSGFEATPGIQR